MRRTFNLGVGLVLVVPEKEADETLAWLRDRGEEVWPIGRVVPAEEGLDQVTYIESQPKA